MEKKKKKGGEGFKGRGGVETDPDVRNMCTGGTTERGAGRRIWEKDARKNDDADDENTMRSHESKQRHIYRASSMPGKKKREIF